MAGIIPRCVNHLFDKIARLKLEFTMHVSFIELYTDEPYDLLSAQNDPPKLRFVSMLLYKDSSQKGACILHDMKNVLVRSMNEVLRLIERGSAKRRRATTLLNVNSTRSHTVFTIIKIKENTLEKVKKVIRKR
ncbi:hypothetical protein HAZT_HAZT011143 [Hyalella azteca]|uniref:Kinesin motor domain-containing protein n=1 Tax=Hyalella azteca TaxID=294128 RepID=A0A6A0GX60_HYAAZ|nr:hypothetical protein HAZT_HAZT011143 [Hyalella azteca]